MSTASRNKPFTFDDFCTLVREDQKADLIDGVIYMASPESIEGNLLFVWLLRLMGDFVEMEELGAMFGTRVAFRINETNGPEPDIAFLRKARLHLARRGFIDGPPDLAIEIVSPEGVSRDYERKFRLYETAGVTEYWIIDEIEEKVTLFRLDRKGKYREVRPKKGELHSRVLPGFWLRPEWLWQSPRPRKNDVLNEILSRKG
jgi:Uma2 family endonuclease